MISINNRKQITTFGEKLNGPIFEKRDLVFATFNPRIVEPDWKSAGFVRVKKISRIFASTARSFSELKCRCKYGSL